MITNTSWESSYNNLHSICLTFTEHRRVRFEQPMMLRGDVALILKNFGGKAIWLKRLDSGLYELDDIPTGSYYLVVAQRNNVDNLYYTLLGVPVRIDVAGIRFLPSPFIYHNYTRLNHSAQKKGFLNESLKNNKYYRTDDADILDMARRVTAENSLIYGKVLAVHQFVANHLAYDYDALEGRSPFGPYDAPSLLKARHCVCQGYATVAIAMLRSLGIPARYVRCATHDGWVWPAQAIINQTKIDHAMVAAFASGRWILMDPTWDSGNIFCNGKFERLGSTDPLYRHFDMSLPYFSLSYKIMEW